MMFLLIIVVVLVSVETKEQAVLHRSVNNNGFHRELTTELKVSKKLLSNLHKCGVIFKEQLPPDAYIDPFQLKNLQGFGGPQFISPYVDIEQAEHRSPSLNVTFFAPPLEITNNVWKTKTTTPIHLRFHKSSVDPEQEYADVVIPNPVILMTCQQSLDYKGEITGEEILPCTSEGSSSHCKWMVIQYTSDADAVQVTVPVGKQSHLIVVICGTLVVTIVSCIVLIYKVYRYNTDNKKIR